VHCTLDIDDNLPLAWTCALLKTDSKWLLISIYIESKIRHIVSTTIHTSYIRSHAFIDPHLISNTSTHCSCWLCPPLEVLVSPSATPKAKAGCPSCQLWGHLKFLSPPLKTSNTRSRELYRTYQYSPHPRLGSQFEG
jgi:hypothetical protein